MASKIQCHLNSDPAGEFYYPDNPNSPDAFADGEPSDANDARLDASDATFVDVYHTDGFTNSGNAIVVSYIYPLQIVGVLPSQPLGNFLSFLEDPKTFEGIGRPRGIRRFRKTHLKSILWKGSLDGIDPRYPMGVPKDQKKF